MIRREVERNVWRGQNPPPPYPGNGRQAPNQDSIDSSNRRPVPSPNGTSERPECIPAKGNSIAAQDGRGSVSKTVRSSSGYHQKALAQIKNSLLPYENGPLIISGHNGQGGGSPNSEQAVIQQLVYNHGYYQVCL